MFKITDFFRDLRIYSYAKDLDIDLSDVYMILDTEAKRCSFRAMLWQDGTWNDETPGLSNGDLNDLFLRRCASHIAKCGIDTENPDWDKYKKGVDAGEYLSHLYQHPNGEIYYVM